MSSYFYEKKKNLSIEDIGNLYEKGQYVDCRHIHPNSCFTHSITSSLKSVWIFKKTLFVYFLIKLIPKIKKFRNFKEFFKFYRNFYQNPLLFIFVFCVIGKCELCMLRKNKILQKKPIVFLFCLLAGSSIFVERENRAKDLSVYIMGTTFETLCEQVYIKLDLDKEKYRRKISEFVFAFSFGMFLHYVVNSKEESMKSMFKYGNRIIPALDLV